MFQSMLTDLWNAVPAAARTQTVLHGRAGEGRPAKPMAVVLPKRTLQPWTETLHSAKDVGWKRIAAQMGLGSELSIASPLRVPKFGKGICEPRDRLARLG